MMPSAARIPLALSLALPLFAFGCGEGSEGDDDDATDPQATATGAPEATDPPATATRAATPTATAEPTDPPPTARPTAIPPSAYDLTVQFLDMGKGAGRSCNLRAVDVADGHEVGRVSQQVISVPNFTLALFDVLEAGHTYDVDIWVDTTNDGVYQPPPETPAQNGTADRSWRLSAASVHADVSLNFVWSTVYTDVAWP